MVGDGLNDGPVLARADVSFALGHGAPLTQSQSDFVVQSGRLDRNSANRAAGPQDHGHRAPEPVVGRRYNAVSVPLALVGWMPPWLAGLGMAANWIGNALRLSRVAVLTIDGVLYLLYLWGVCWASCSGGASGAIDNIEREGERFRRLICQP
jgi:P-type Cu2+ transporter